MGLLTNNPPRPTRRGVTLHLTPRTDPRLQALMPRHYSRPRGFVGRTLVYAVRHGGRLYGFTIAGSATLHLPGRSEFLRAPLNSVVNNTFFHVEPLELAPTPRTRGKGGGRHLGTREPLSDAPWTAERAEREEGRAYPVRNFTQEVVRLWRESVLLDWPARYGDPVLGFETLVEPPRTGECYLRDGWTLVGTTKGLTARRVPGREAGTGKFARAGGRRTWDYEHLRPKLVLCRRP